MKSKTPLTAGTLAAILIGVLVALGAFRSPAPAVSPSPSAATGAQASPPVATAPPSPAITTPPSPVPSGPPAGGIEAYALGQLRGEWVFAINGGEATEAGSIAEIWAVPLAGGEARLAARYTNFPASGFARSANVLARQFSPDGRRLLLSAGTPRASGGTRRSLVIVELETGQKRIIGADDNDSDVRPAWSPDGSRIAYVRQPTVSSGGAFDDGIWVMNVDGSGARRVIPGQQGAGSFLFGWSADSRTIAWAHSFEDATLTLTDVTTGAQIRIGNHLGDMRPSFRAKAPRIAGSFVDQPRCGAPYLFVADGAPEQILFREPDSGNCQNPHIGNVRWHPTGDEVLYLRVAFPAKQLHLRDTVTQRAAIVSVQGDPTQVEWSPTGTHLLYINRGTQTPFLGTEVRYVGRDATGERTVLAPRLNAALSDLATRAYP